MKMKRTNLPICDVCHKEPSVIAIMDRFVDNAILYYIGLNCMRDLDNLPLLNAINNSAVISFEDRILNTKVQSAELSHKVPLPRHLGSRHHIIGKDKIKLVVWHLQYSNEGSLALFDLFNKCEPFDIKFKVSLKKVEAIIIGDGKGMIYRWRPLITDSKIGIEEASIIVDGNFRVEMLDL